jgi:hypothetical protein
MDPDGRTVIKHPASAYLIVGFVAICVTAVVRAPLTALVYLVPALAALYVARTATIVDRTGLTARGLFGHQQVSWAELTGLRVLASGNVYAVAADNSQLRLPCVRGSRLGPLITAAGGRIPDPAGGNGVSDPARPTSSGREPVE